MVCIFDFEFQRKNDIYYKLSNDRIEKKRNKTKPKAKQICREIEGEKVRKCVL